MSRFLLLCDSHWTVWEFLWFSFRNGFPHSWHGKTVRTLSCLAISNFTSCSSILISWPLESRLKGLNRKIVGMKVNGLRGSGFGNEWLGLFLCVPTPSICHLFIVQSAIIPFRVCDFQVLPQSLDSILFLSPLSLSHSDSLVIFTQAQNEFTAPFAFPRIISKHWHIFWFVSKGKDRLDG